jgi:hypothetical protein
MKKKKKADEMIQSVVIIFDDGQEAMFTGKAVLFEDETKKIRKISFTTPQHIPEGCSWETLKTEDRQTKE